jgi:signal peptidase I
VKFVLTAVLIAVAIIGAIAALLSPLIIRTLIFEPFTIPSAAMAPTLLEGDYVIVSKGAYGYSRHSFIGSPPIFGGRQFFHPPSRGDIVVFKLPRDGRTSYIKRVIGLPGDHIQVRHAVVYINRKALGQTLVGKIQTSDRGFAEEAEIVRETNPEGRSYLIQSHNGDGPQDNTGVYTVPAHCYFMIGDNRENSADSRFDPGLAPDDPKLGGCGWDRRLDDQVGGDAGVGFVPEVNLVGRAWMVIRSDRSGRLRTLVPE